MKMYFIFSFIFIFQNLNAEIEEIILKWNAQLCLNVCAPLLEKQLLNIPNIANLQLNDRAGVAVMRWKPNYPFNYEPFNLATRTVGIRIEDFRVRVRGTILQDHGNFFMVSMGDNTSFLLLGPALDKPGRYVTKNIATRQLSDQMKIKLANLAQNRTVVEVEGPLYEPLRYTLSLIIQQLKIDKTAEMSPQYNL